MKCNGQRGSDGSKKVFDCQAVGQDGPSMISNLQESSIFALEGRT